MTEQEIEQLVNKICDGKFVFKAIHNVNHSQGHPYVIGAKHVVHVSDHFCGSLSDEAIRDLEEKQGPSCACSGCHAYYDDHKSNKVLFLSLLCNLENKEAADALYQVRLQVLEPEKIDGITFVETPEQYRIAPPKIEEKHE